MGKQEKEDQQGQVLERQQQSGLDLLSPKSLSDRPGIGVYQLLYQKLQQEGKSRDEALADVAAYVYAWSVAKAVLEAQEISPSNPRPDNEKISSWFETDFGEVFNFGRKLKDIPEGEEVMAGVDMGGVVTGGKLPSPTFGLIKITGAEGKYEPVGSIYKIADFPRGAPPKQMAVIADRLENRQINMQTTYGSIGIPPAYREMFSSTMDLSSVATKTSAVPVAAA